MEEKRKVQLFEERQVRSVWDGKNKKWLFSVVDVVGILTNQADPRGATLYWGKLKQRLKEEGNELLTNCDRLKLTAADGKMRLIKCD